MEKFGAIHCGYEYLDLETWKRARHFNLYREAPFPYIGSVARVDVTGLVRRCRESKRSLFAAFLYATTKALNSIENFRYRIQEGKPVLLERVVPNFVALDPESELFYFAEFEYDDDFAVFSARTAEARDEAIRTRCLSGNRLDVFYTSALPWLDFSDAIQPLALSANDSIPRIAWGKYRDDGGVLTLPFSITGHHGLFDGLHIGKLLEAMDGILREPGFL